MGPGPLRWLAWTFIVARPRDSLLLALLLPIRLIANKQTLHTVTISAFTDIMPTEKYCTTRGGEYVTRNLHLRGQARIIPILLRPCDWQNTPLATLQALPSHGKPVTSWPTHDDAF